MVGGIIRKFATALQVSSCIWWTQISTPLKLPNYAAQDHNFGGQTLGKWRKKQKKTHFIIVLSLIWWHARYLGGEKKKGKTMGTQHIRNIGQISQDIQEIELGPRFQNHHFALISNNQHLQREFRSTGQACVLGQPWWSHSIYTWWSYSYPKARTALSL